MLTILQRKLQKQEKENRKFKWDIFAVRVYNKNNTELRTESKTSYNLSPAKPRLRANLVFSQQE